MVYSASELNRSTGLPVLGALASDRTKKAGKLDAKLYQMEGRPDGSADAEMPVSYTHLDVYKRQVLCPAAVGIIGVAGHRE